jgi:glycosyltransferase involved in cell wall biosynthesis
MKISVLINNYNYANYIKECLDSVQNQNRPADEVIVVDDGSTDNSVELIKEHPLHPVCLEKENGGQYTAMQLATQTATGDIFCYLDSDDTWHPDYLKTVAEAFNSPYKPDFVYAGMGKFGQETGAHHLNLTDVEVQFIPKSQQIVMLKRMYYGGPTSANSIRSMYAQQLFKTSNSNTASQFKICADEILVYGASLIGCSKLQLSDEIAYYRIHGENNHYVSQEYNETNEESLGESYDARYNDLLNFFATDYNIENSLSKLCQEMCILIRSGRANRALIKPYLKSPKKLGVSYIEKKYWKIRFKLAYRYSRIMSRL